MSEPTQENPLTLRLWKEVRDKVYEQANAMYNGNVNATINLLVMRGLGFGDYDIEERCKSNMRKHHAN